MKSNKDIRQHFLCSLHTEPPESSNVTYCCYSAKANETLAGTPFGQGCVEVEGSSQRHFKCLLDAILTPLKRLSKVFKKPIKCSRTALKCLQKASWRIPRLAQAGFANARVRRADIEGQPPGRGSPLPKQIKSQCIWYSSRTLPRQNKNCQDFKML